MRPDGTARTRLAGVVPLAAFAVFLSAWLPLAQQGGGPPAGAQTPAATAAIPSEGAAGTDGRGGEVALLGDETNTIAVVDRLGPSVVAIDVVAGGQLTARFPADPDRDVAVPRIPSPSGAPSGWPTA